MKSVDVKDLGKIAVVMGGSSGEREVSLMSGSGPTVFGLYETKEKARKAAAKIAQIYPNYQKNALPENRKETQCKGCRNHESN